VPNRYVLDASAVALLFLDQPRSTEFESWYHERRKSRCRFFAPDLLPYELANILHRERGATTDAKNPDYLVQIVRDATQGIVLETDSWTRTWSWAGTLSAYDAAYAALADAKDATLVTYDEGLTKAAMKRLPVIGAGGLD
jgi:predicted nucleic acid-binding protein